MSQKSPVTPAQFINILVTAIPSVDPISKEITYKTTFMPEAIEVMLPDTIINYQLIDPTPAGVKFSEVTIAPASDQLSQPIIGQSGRILTLSDANTLPLTFNLSLGFKDNDGVKFIVDPEIKNDPRVNPPI